MSAFGIAFLIVKVVLILAVGWVVLCLTFGIGMFLLALVLTFLGKPGLMEFFLDGERR